MISRTNAAFWKRFERLSEEIQDRARSAYARFEVDPRHPGLRFKRIHGADDLVSVRISRNVRAVGVQIAADEILCSGLARTTSTSSSSPRDETPPTYS